MPDGFVIDPGISKVLNSLVIDMYNGEVANVRSLGITESYKLKRQVLLSASEAAELILRVDDIIRCAPR